MNQQNEDTNILLEKLVAEKTIELTKAQESLRIALDAAEAASRAKSEFLARMSHEMLTPLNAIMGFSELAKTSGDYDQIISWNNKIYDSSKHLLEILRNVLDVSEGNSALSIVESQFSIVLLIKNALNKIDYDLKKKNQTISLSISQSIPKTLFGDEKRVTQVITHLLSNAVKFSPDHGKINLNISIHDEENEAITLKIEVIDNGIGVSKEQQEILFDLFEQVDGGSTRRYEGIGIGLSLSKCIVKMMDGDIWVESEPGKGSKFSFTCKVKKNVIITD
ncbi:MAG: ATP-binding protein [Treponema sp.]|nr:ATP-binding protein [Treponema sp.]